MKSIRYSAAGAQPIAATTVNGSTATVVTGTEGITTLSFFATDNEGNVSYIGTHVVRLDETAPEALLALSVVGRSEAAAAIHTLQYNEGAVRTATPNTAGADWELATNGSLRSLDQTFGVLSPLQAVTASWRSNDDETDLRELVDGKMVKTRVPGMRLLRLATNDGALAIETGP